MRLNDRQRLVINRLLDQFDGNLTTSKYAALAKCSQDTAYRDILELIERRVLVQRLQRRTQHQLFTHNSAIAAF